MNSLNVATFTRASALTQSGSSWTPGIIRSFPPLNVLRKVSLSSRIRSVLIFASLNDVGEDEAAHDFGFTAILAASRALIRLHLCRAAAPFGFMTNWLHHFFWEVGLAHPRSIAGFFSLPDLLRLHFIREHKKPLKDTPIDKHICERAYQHEAIRRVADLRRNLHYLVPAMVDLTGLSAGLTGTAQLVVGPEHTAAFVGSGRIAVLATPVMINVIEFGRAQRSRTPSTGRPSKSRHPPRRKPCRCDAGRVTGERNRHGFARGRSYNHVPRRGRDDRQWHPPAGGRQRCALRRTHPAQGPRSEMTLPSRPCFGTLKWHLCRDSRPALRPRLNVNLTA